ncbi:armadillo repeat-containing protein 3-like [Xenia sp. Carnegie-2017]|uniref:armadillo repeat-containing protein 3-like n=1 Tax=Xenia sp. Carnegie-2017 TaxID=2897299 RepID=UPI001F03C4C0|nr:armadillo repeat-containing protein 3-like [Xenia sp. Carnegie-2017]
MGKKKAKEPEPPAKDEFDPLQIVSKSPGTVVLMLDSQEETVLQAACEALYKFSEKCEENRQTLLNLGVLERLLKHILSEDKIIKRNSIMCLGTLSQNVNVRKILRKLNCIESLIILLRPEEEALCHEFASLALTMLAGKFGNKVEIFEKHGLESLIRLLTSTDCDIQKNAVECISLLVEDYQSRIAIKKLNGFEPLLALLDSQYAIIQDLALSTLLNCSYEAENREELRQLEGLQKIINFIGIKEYDDLHVKAIQVLSNCMQDIESMKIIQSSGSLQKMLKFASESVLPEVQQHAAKSLAIAAQREETRKILHEQECEKTLISLLANESSMVQAAASEALAVMSESLIIREEIGKLDGIPYLVSLLKAEDAEVRHFSSLALANLSSSTSNASILMEKGGAEALVRLLNDSKPRTQVNASVCLTNLARNESWRMEIHNYGIIPNLVNALDSSNPSVQCKIAMTVASFLCDVKAKTQFREEGGLVALVNYLSSNVSDVRRAASWAMVVCGSDPAIATELTTLGAMEQLQTIALSGSRKSGFSDVALTRLLDCNLPAKYSMQGYLSSSNITGHGFFDRGKIRPEDKILTLEELSRVPLNTSRPVFYVNFTINESTSSPKAEVEVLTVRSSEKLTKTSKLTLKETKRSKSQAQFEKTAESCEEGWKTPDSMQNPEESLPWQPPSDPNLPYYISTMKERLTSLSSLEEQIAQLARFVSETMGGSCEKNWLQSFNYELHISNLKKEFNSNLIPIGCVKAGIYYHRALLFKVLADCLCIPCSLVRGEYNRAWNEVMICLESQKNDKIVYPSRTYIVDLMHEPGTLMAANSPEADGYKRL